MIPIGAIIGALAASRGVRNGAYGRTDPRVANALLRFLAWCTLGPGAAVLLKELPWAGRTLLALLLVGSFPALTLRAVIVPLGLPRLAYWYAIVNPPIASSREIGGGAALMGALALARSRLDERERLLRALWLDGKLAGAMRARALWMAAAALVAAERGKPETARRLLRAVDGISWRSPRAARRVARSWLVAEAAERGGWKEIAALGDRSRGYLRWPYAMSVLARRLLSGPRAPSDAHVWLAWLVAPNRVATWPLVRRALLVPRTGAPQRRAPTAPPRAAEAGEGDEAVAVALRAHAACLRHPTESTLAAAGSAWDAVRASSAVRSLLARRAASLDAKATPDAALAALLATAEADLAAHLVGVSAALLARSGTLDAASLQSRQRVLGEIESLSSAMAQRNARKTALHVTGEWMHWGALRGLCDGVGRDCSVEVRRSVFVTVYPAACNYAVWLFNARGEKVLASSIFRWLAEEARAVGDATALALLEKNVKVGEGT